MATEGHLPPQASLPLLQTPRLALRPMELGDAADVYAYVADPAVLRYTTGVTPTRPSETEAFLQRALANPETHMWAIRLRDHTRVIGAIEFGTSSPTTGSVHYALGAAYWGRGLMSEAVEAVSAWAFATLPRLDEIVTAVAEANVASARVLEKCRFERIGTADERWAKEPEPVRLILFRRERDSLLSRRTS
jgi:ribosomal-protein-alanine N-acetyltransferase